MGRGVASFLWKLKRRNLHLLETTLEADITGTTPYVSLLTSIDEGTGDNERTNDTVTLSSLDIPFSLNIYFTNGTAGNDFVPQTATVNKNSQMPERFRSTVSVQIVRVKENQSTAPTLAELYSSSEPFYQMRNLAETREFQIIYRRNIRANFHAIGHDGTDYVYGMHPIRIRPRLPIRGSVVKYTGTTGATSSWGSLWLVVHANAHAVANSHKWRFYAKTRLRFFD